jgi:hypothetical protein
LAARLLIIPFLKNNLMTNNLQIPIFFGLSIEVYFILLLISFPTYFFLHWVFRKRLDDKTKRNIVALVSTIILTPIIYLGLIGIFIYFISREPSSDFVKSKWLTDREGRFEMGDDIVKSKILIGKDTNQVKELLGRATFQDSLNVLWTYDMGCGGGGLGFLFHNLSVQFDKGKVFKVDHIRIKD